MLQFLFTVHKMQTSSLHLKFIQIRPRGVRVMLE